MKRRYPISAAFILTIMLVLVSLIPATSAASPPPQEISERSLVAVYYATQAELDAVGAEYDVWTVYADEGYALALLWPDEYAALVKAGYQMEVIEEMAAGIQASLDPRYHYFDDYVYNSNGRYLTDWLQATAASHPDLTELFDIGNAWQAGHGGYHRDMWVLRITNEDPTYGPIEEKPAFFLFATIHAREVAVAELALRYAEYLLNGYQGMGGYGVDPDVTWLVNHNVAYLLVMQNPDGHAVNELDTSAYRRKNMDNDDGCNNPGTWGVDLNRNHSFFWGCCGGSSGNPCSETYRGPSPASEPETQVFQNFFASVMQDQNGPNGDYEIPPPAPDDARDIFISLHSYSDVVLWPWGPYQLGPAPNAEQLAKIGRKLAYYNGYDASGGIGYNVDGATDDWTYGKFGIASFTIEVGSQWGTCGGFFPPYDCLDGYAGRSFWAENRPAFLYAHKIARAPYMIAYGPDTLAPTITPVAVSPGDPATLSAAIQDRRLSGEPLRPVAGAEYFIDAPGQDGTGTSMIPSDGTWGETLEEVEAVIDTSGLATGTYYVLVHGINSDGKWGPFGAAWLTIEEVTEPVMFVGDIAMGYRVASQTTYQVGGRVPIYDEELQPVGGATVTVEATLPNGQTLVRSADTRPNGAALFTGFSPQEGIYTLTVLDVQADGYVYDPERNLETSEQLQVP